MQASCGGNMLASGLVARFRGNRCIIALGKNLLAVICISLSAIILPPTSRAQHPPPDRVKDRDFGSSLKRLKWDAEKKKSVRADGEKGVVSGSDDEEILRVEISLVVCDVLVLDKQGYAVRGLTREDFQVTEDGTPQEVGTFSLGDDVTRPRSIVLIIDYSPSMRPFIKNSIEAAEKLVDQLAPRDRMAIVTDDIELLAGFTRDKAKLKEALEVLKTRVGSVRGHSPDRFGRSQQYTALMAALNELFDAEDIRPIIIFQTDGDEVAALRDSNVPSFRPPPRLPSERPKAAQVTPESRLTEFSFADVQAAAERVRATIYSIIPGIRLVGLTPGEEQVKIKRLRAQLTPRHAPRPSAYSALVNDEILKYTVEQTPKMQLALLELSKLTGGWADFLEEPSQAADVYSRIFSDINRRYVIGYYPTNKARDGRRRRVSIEVRGHPDYTVWGRHSYYAPEPVK